MGEGVSMVSRTEMVDLMIAIGQLEVRSVEWEVLSNSSSPPVSYTHLVETGVYNEISQVMQDVQMEAGCTWIVAEATVSREFV